MKHRGFLFAVFISGGVVATLPEAAFAGQYMGRWQRVMTAEGEEPDPRDNAGCAAFLRSDAFDPAMHSDANLTITPSRMETNEEGSDVTLLSAQPAPGEPHSRSGPNMNTVWLIVRASSSSTIATTSRSPFTMSRLMIEAPSATR